LRVFRTHAFARAGLVGNPSDGYHGRTISLIVRNFCAEAVIYDWPELEIMPTRQDQCRFSNLSELLADLSMNGYYGGMRLVKGAIKRFADYCQAESIELAPQNFSIRYNSNIPRQVGLAGSSAIVTATMRALCRFYDVPIDEDILPSLILSVESKELGIAAGLQDRVAQVFEGLVYMDFDKEYMIEHGHGRYERLDPALLPPVFIAYQQDLAESSEVFHNDIRRRYESGEPKVIDAINRIAELARLGREALLSGDAAALGVLINENFDLRRSIYHLNPKHVEMVEIARGLGLPAHFAGSGGSVIGLYDTEESFQRLERAFALRQCSVIKPVVSGQ
jgi:glucuronokinase